VDSNVMISNLKVEVWNKIEIVVHPKISRRCGYVWA